MTLLAHIRSGLLWLSLALASATPSALCSCTGDAGAEGPVQNRVEMKITDKGFEPQNLRVKKGEPVTLIITRKTDLTCATEIVIDEYNINVKLPLNQAVTVTFTPNKSGELKYGCAMKKMIGGVIKVL
jgi:plastocyanin domain-containing protein